MTASYQTPVDIGNRALQHVGATRITAFSDNSKNAAAISFVYDKSRETELRRSLWIFATKKAVLRPLDTTTLFPVIPAWAAGSYTMAALVKDSGSYWIAARATSSTPGVGNDWQMYAGPLSVNLWSTGSVWFTGELVYMTGVPNTVYFSLISANDQVPTDLGQTGWVALNITTTPFQFLYPVGTGPMTQSGTKNVFRRPANFLRTAPRDPKDGSSSWLGAPTGLTYDDWVEEGDFILTMDGGPIVYRFVANISDVTQFDAMFCEGLALRIAMEIVEELTQSSEKMQTVVALYKELMGEAREVNGIEVGSQEAALDDYITCRI